jgi:hypothetical protein
MILMAPIDAAMPSVVQNRRNHTTVLVISYLEVPAIRFENV